MNTTEIQTKIQELKTFITVKTQADPTTSILMLAPAIQQGLDELETLIDQETGKADLAQLAREGGGPGRTVLPNYDEKMQEAFEVGFNAVVYLWDATLQKHYERPDAKTRLETAKLYLAYRMGMPAQMILKLDANGFKDRQVELLELARTPAGREALLRAGLISEDWIIKHLPANETPKGTK